MHLERRRIRLVGWIVRRQGLHPLPTKTPRREPPLRSPRAERAFRLRCRQRSRCVALPPLTYPIWGAGCKPAAQQTTRSFVIGIRLALSDFPNLRWRRAIAPAEIMIEIREVAKSRLISDGANGPLGKARVGQYAIGKRQALVAQEFGESDALALEEFVHIARCDAMACRDGSHIQVAIPQICHDVAFDPMQSCSANAVVFRDDCAVACRSDR